MHDPGMAEFHEKWAEAGYPLPWSWKHTRDEREEGPAAIRFAKGAGAYARENAEMLLTAVGIESNAPEGPIDAVGGTIGSLDKIYVYPVGRDRVKIEVHNRMDWESGLRIPGTNESIAKWNIPGIDQSVGDFLMYRLGWGTTPLQQKFYWWEPMPDPQ